MSSTDYRGRLIAARTRLGLTPRQMAERLLTPRQTYEQWERGSRRTPGAAVVAVELLRLRAPRALRPWPVPGSTAARVLELADGTRTAPEIAAAIGKTRADVYAVRQKALERGLPCSIADAPRGPRGTTGATSEKSARNAQIVADMHAGLLLATIAAKYGITVERVRQIAYKRGVTPRLQATRARAAADEERLRVQRAADAAKRAEIDATLIDLVRSGTSIRQACLRVGIDPRNQGPAAKRLGLGKLTQHGRWRLR